MLIAVQTACQLAAYVSADVMQCNKMQWVKVREHRRALFILAQIELSSADGHNNMVDHFVT